MSFLFNADIIDVVNDTHQTQFIIDADDTNLLFSRNDADELIRMANFVLNKRFWRPEVNELKISKLKTKAVLISPVNKLVDITNPLKLGTALVGVVR